MGSITSLDYAEMACRVYEIDKSGGSDQQCGPWSYQDYECTLFESGMGWGGTNTDFKGCVYVSADLPHAVVAFQGTVPAKGGDLVADLQIAIGGLVGMLPQYCSAALRLLDRTLQTYPNHTISLVGHSLGGGMAQVIGHWTGLPFVTFNAPGMWGDIQKSKVFFQWNPFDSFRSIRGTFKGSLLSKQMATTGRNFRAVLDPVSAYGFHYGPVTRFWCMKFHSMSDMVETIRSSAWKDKDPLDRANKEWGEL